MRISDWSSDVCSSDLRMTARRVARVLLDSPLPQLDRLFDYAIPADAEVAPGVRVRVPLRSAGRLVDGYVVEIDEADDGERPLSANDTVVSDRKCLVSGQEVSVSVDLGGAPTTQ